MGHTVESPVDRTSPGSRALGRAETFPDAEEPTSRISMVRDRATDRELVDRTRAGDPSSFDDLVRRHQGRIYRLTVHMMRNAGDADDLTQETFVRAYRALDRFDGRSEFFTWIYRIAVNLCLNAMRSRRHRVKDSSLDDDRLEGVEPSDDSERPDDDALRKQTYAGLCHAIDDLSETLRTTVILVCVDGLSHDEAAAVLGAPSGTIAWRVHEARRKMKEFMVARGFDPEGDGT